jgi:hypothetical protein
VPEIPERARKRKRRKLTTLTRVVLHDFRFEQ